MLTALVFIVTLGILIFVHELGHFLVARRNGIRSEEFGFGFPPRILGIQFLSGKKKEKISEVESIEIKKTDIKIGNEELLSETVTEKIHQTSQTVPVRKWRFIWGNYDGDDKQERKDIKEAQQKKYAGGTIYSLNWIPLGGFVKIKGEDGESKDEDSFSGKPAWVRTKVLAAGVTMNFILAWVILSIALTIGTPQAVSEQETNLSGAKIQISQVIPQSPAEKMGLKIGDEIMKCKNAEPICQTEFPNIAALQNFVSNYKDKEITLEVQRGKQKLEISGVPRSTFPTDQGPLGVSLVQTKIVSYPWYQAIVEGLKTTINLIGVILVTFFEIIKNLIMGDKVEVDVAGPVGIAYITKQVTELGFVYILQFVALLSINLGIINALPFPALDGGRMLFILIEKIKGVPVDQKIERLAHSIGFALLIMLMILVTFRDFAQFNIWEKIKSLF